ncbi:MAG: IS4 family transposase [Deltaproteobacteria bacterium]|nr:IS4 family transposase [Deltaproteobacteria bacterium]
MNEQNQVKRTLQGNINEVREHIAEHSELSRTALALSVCERFGFHNARGAPQKATCLKALREFAAEDILQIPESRTPKRGASPARRLADAVPLPRNVPGRVDRIKDLRLRLVSSEDDSRTWNECIIREHPFGERRLVGRQLRYLVESSHGCLGALAFSSSALQLAERDQWLGWNTQQRQAHLDKIVCLSRFLIRPGVECANLASKVLGMVVSVFSEDFEHRYGYRPWLIETFVETTQHNGTSLEAANWLKIGQSKGRGRQDQTNQSSETIKDIYLYVLNHDFRTELGVPEYEKYPAIAPDAGLDSDEWAQHEFGAAELGDKRLSQRLVSIAAVKSAFPGLPFLEAVNGQAAPVAGYYRFVDRPDESCVQMANILAPHRDRTLQRMQHQDRVLCIHDTTDLNYSTLHACEGLGVISKNQTRTEIGGLRLHSSYVVTAKEGLPLGLLNWNCYAPKLMPERKGKDARLIPAEEKETYRWIENMAGCIAAETQLHDTHVTHVMDREGDFFELFHAWREIKKDDLLVRAKHNRSIATRRGDDKTREKIFDSVAALPVMGILDVEVPRKSARTKNGRRAAQPARAKRTANLELRWMPTQVSSPEYGLGSQHPPVDMWILHAREIDSSYKEAKPIEWYLLSSAPIQDESTAITLLECYATRWRIEDWHRILKTCCRVESPAHRDAECLKRLIAINMVIAWRIHLMTLLGREAPDLPMEVLFSDLELRVLKLFSKERDLVPPTTLGEAVITVARMGGYMNRKHDPPPGAEILWRGHRRLSLLSQGLALIQLE